MGQLSVAECRSGVGECALDLRLVGGAITVRQPHPGVWGSCQWPSGVGECALDLRLVGAAITVRQPHPGVIAVDRQSRNQDTCFAAALIGRSPGMNGLTAVRSHVDVRVRAARRWPAARPAARLRSGTR